MHLHVHFVGGKLRIILSLTAKNEREYISLGDHKMSMPISGKHSIEVANFVCVFSGPFSETSIQGLLSLQELFKEDFPIFNTNIAYNIHIDGKEKAPVSSNRIAGVSLQNINKETGKPFWTIRTEPQAIVVSCFEYSRWDVESKRAIGILKKIFSVVDDGRNPITQIILHVIDRFVGGHPDTYHVKQIFNTKSPFLTKKVLLSGPLWHLHQGWFEIISDTSEKILNNLNLSTNTTHHGMLTTIDHTLTHSMGFNVPLSSQIDDQLKGIFDLLHSQNKKVLIDLLNTRQCKMIKLCQ